LVLSEIIPKTLGASYWKVLAPFTAYSLTFLIFILNPFIKILEFITRNMLKKESMGFKRSEFSIMAELSA
jgi:CBS domain containing-hemolysin-like protein